MLRDEIMQTSVEGVTEKLVATEIGEKVRKTGIAVIGDAPWGTHFCQFYETKEDLVDVLVPYFKAGLENNEFCMWVTSEPLNKREAEEAMRKAVPNFDRYLKRGQIQIVPYTEWYLKGGTFNLQRVLNGWVEKLNQALAEGYDGMRVAGNTGWLEKRDWRNFVDYEQEVNDVIGKYRMIVICTYSLDKCRASEILDVVCNHQFAVIKREGKWELIESSELKRAKEQFRILDESLQNTFDNMLEGCQIIGYDWRYLYVNDAVVKHGRTTKERGLGKTMMEMYPGIEKTEMFSKLQRCMKERVSIRMENEFEFPDGEKGWFELNIQPVPEGIFILSIDITKRKKAEEELKRYSEYLENIFAASPDAITVSDINGNVIQCNQATLDMLGFSSKEELIGKSGFSFIVKKDHQKAAEHLKKTFGQGSVKNVQYTFLTKDGHEIQAELSASVIRDASGNPTGFVSVTKDITERKNMEEQLKEYAGHLEEKVEERTNQLKKAQEQLLKAERLAAIGEVATMVGHDLRNPLQVITNAVYTLKNHCAPVADSVLMDERFKEYRDLMPELILNEIHKRSVEAVDTHNKMINTIDESIKYADKIVSDLQDFARTTELEPIEINLESLIQEPLSGISIPKNVKISIKHDQRLSKLYVDPYQIRRVFTNLTINAIQAMENGGTLTISTNKTNGFLKVSFKDTGVGIPKENMEKIFLPLFTTKAKGMGIGLPICKKLVEIHGGTIKVESEIGKGTTVTVKLPITKENGGEKT